MSAILVQTGLILTDLREWILTILLEWILAILFSLYSSDDIGCQISVINLVVNVK